MSSSALAAILMAPSDAPHTWRRQLYFRHRFNSRYKFAPGNFNLDRTFLLERLFRRLEDSDDIGSECSVSPVGIALSRRVVLDTSGEVENLLSQSIVRDDHHAFYGSLPVEDQPLFDAVEFRGPIAPDYRYVSMLLHVQPA